MAWIGPCFWRFGAQLQPGQPLVLRHEIDLDDSPADELREFAELRKNRVIWAEPMDPWHWRAVRDLADERREEEDDEDR